jgi:hypothetical protein
LRGLARDLAGVQGARLHKQVASGDISYRVYCFVKD